MQNYPKVAIIYLSYHSEPFLERAVAAWEKINYPKDRITFVLLDNPHPNYGSSVNFIKTVISSVDREKIPSIVFLPQDNNLGFAGGHNVGMQWAIDNDCDYVFFHNLDGFVSSDAIIDLVEVMEKDNNIAIAQSLIKLFPETDLINTSGNKFHYLGFGYCGDYRKKTNEVNLFQHEIAYASGAAMMVRVEVLKQSGLLDEEFFAYHEDLEFSLRLRVLGYKIVLVPQSIFYHEYEFGRNASKFYLMERNRLGLMLMYFKWRTLLLFLPVELGVGLAEFAVSIRDGWVKSWLHSRWYWLSFAHWKLWLSKRARIQNLKKVTDFYLLSLSVGKIEFDGAGMGGRIMKWGNKLVDIYGRAVKKMIKW